MDEENTTKSVTAENNNAVTVKKSEISNNLTNFNLFDEKQLAAAEVFLKKVISSDKFGIKNVPDGLAVLMRAQDLNLPFSSCISHVHVINGKTGIDIHLIKALLTMNGITWECTKDYAPVYQYTDGSNIYLDTQLPDYCIRCKNAKEAEDKTNEDTIGVYPVKFYQDLQGNVFTEYQINNKVTIALNKVHAMSLVKENKYPVLRIPAQPVDYITEFEFTRYLIIHGKEVVRKCKSHFSLSEATKAELLTKDTYVKYCRIMIETRAFTLGARDIADDVLMGHQETNELKIVENVPLVDSDFVNAEVLEN